MRPKRKRCIAIRKRAAQAALFFCAPGRAHSLGGVSPLHTRQGEVLAEQQGCPSRGGIWRKLQQSAALTNSQRIEATRSGEQAKLCKAQYLHGRSRRKSDRHKREGECVIPGEVCWFALGLRSSRGDGMSQQKSAAAIVAWRERSEGPNVKHGSRTADLDASHRSRSLRK